MPSLRFWTLYRAISQLEAQDDLRAVSVAFYGGNPDRRGEAILDFTNDLRNQALRKGQAGPGAYGIPTSALSGPMVSEVEGSIIHERLERAARQVEEQQEAWKVGSWPALQQVLARQQAENRAAP